MTQRYGYQDGLPTTTSSAVTLAVYGHVIGGLGVTVQYLTCSLVSVLLIGVGAECVVRSMLVEHRALTL